MIKKLKNTAQRSRYARHVLFAFVCWFSMPVSAATVYINDFQSAVGTGWSSADNTIGITQAPNTDFVRKFLGEFSNGTVSLSLTGLPDHATTTVSFSLYLIRSWDGNATTIVNGDPLGPDHWTLNVGGGPTLLNTTFSNGGTVGQAYAPSPFAAGCTGYNLSGLPSGEYNPMTGASECYSLGYTFSSPYVTKEAMDSVYNLSFTFNHSASNLVLNFSAAGLQGITDESWGLDNVQVAVAPVPVPPAVWLFGSGLLGLVGVARRKKTA